MPYIVKNETGELIVSPSQAKRLKELKNTIDKAKKEQDLIKNGIKAEFELYEQKTTNFGEIQVVYAEPYYDLELDEKLLREKYPEIYNECLMPTYHQSTTSVKFVERKKKGE